MIVPDALIKIAQEVGEKLRPQVKISARLQVRPTVVIRRWKVEGSLKGRQTSNITSNGRRLADAVSRFIKKV